MVKDASPTTLLIGAALGTALKVSGTFSSSKGTPANVTEKKVDMQDKHETQELPEAPLVSYDVKIERAVKNY